MWTDRQIKGFKPREGRYRLSEPIKHRGLGRLVVEVQPTGNKAFFFQYFRNGQRNMVSIGRYIHINPTTLAHHARSFCEDYEGEKFVPRDIRRTFKTLAGKAGLSKEIRDRIQNHVVQDVSTKHYDKYDYLKEKQAAMKVWNDYLELIIHPVKNVTQLKRA